MDIIIKKQELENISSLLPTIIYNELLKFTEEPISIERDVTIPTTESVVETKIDKSVLLIKIKLFKKALEKDKSNKVLKIKIKLFEKELTKYAKGGGLSNSKYIPNRMVQSVEVERKGKTTDIDGADILDGFRVKKGVKFAKGSTVKDNRMNERTRAVIVRLQKTKADPEYVSPNYVNDVANKMGVNLTSEEVVFISDNFGEKYAKGGGTSKVWIVNIAMPTSNNNMPKLIKKEIELGRMSNEFDVKQAILRKGGDWIGNGKVLSVYEKK